MACAVPDGWGGGQWGKAPWGGAGGAGSTDLVVLNAVAVRENVVRVEFNVAPLLTGTLDPNDASDRHRWAVAPVPGGVGLDGLQVRPVAPVQAARANVPNGAGRFIDVTVDRPFSAYPCRYRVAANNLVTPDGFTLNPCFTGADFYAVRAAHVSNNPEAVLPRRDVASPQSLNAFLSIPDPALQALGAFAVDATGDYATDSGIINLKKRIYRRLLTTKGAYAHLPDYGVGVPQYGKRLATAAARQEMVAEAERQLRQEPDVAAVSVQLQQRRPGLFALLVLVRTVAGAGLKCELPIDVTVQP